MCTQNFPYVRKCTKKLKFLNHFNNTHENVKLTFKIEQNN